MKDFCKILFICLLTLLFSCEESPIWSDCADCLESQPETATLSISIERPQAGTGKTVTINIYQGNIEDNILYRTISTESRQTEVSVIPNKQYTLAATYTTTTGRHITVIDTAYPRFRYDEEKCDNPCYFLFDYKVNLKTITF